MQQTTSARHEPLERGREIAGSRPPRRGRSVLWHVFLANAAVLVVAATLLALTPVTISAPIALAEVAVLAAGLACMLAADLFLIRRALAPLRHLTALMLTIDPLRPGRRLERPRTHDTEVVALTDAFNAMLDRLEDERRESARRALAAQEAERRRIARELHDEIGQTLTAVTLQAERAAASGGDEGELLAIAAETRRSLDDVRRIARELRPEALDDLGLVNALIALCTRVQGQGGVHVERRLTGGLPPLTAEAELVIYRVAQESLTNVIRHAAATHAVVSLDHSDGRVTLSVSDDGRGLPEPLPARTNGISGMRERAMLVGGRLSVSTPAGGGTEVRLELPVATP